MHHPLRKPHLLLLALASLGLGGCGTINEKLAAGVSDAIPSSEYVR